MTNYILIQICSLMDEWKAFGRLGENEEVRQTLKAAKPATDRIKRWKGLRKWRSGALAHGFRNEVRKPLRLEELLVEGSVPTAFAEMLLLGECAVIAAAIAIHRHDEERQVALANWHPDGPPEIGCYGIEKTTEFDRDIDDIVNKISSDNPDLLPIFANMRPLASHF